MMDVLPWLVSAGMTLACIFQVFEIDSLRSRYQALTRELWEERRKLAECQINLIEMMDEEDD